MFGFRKKKPFKNDKELTQKEFVFLNELAERLSFLYPSFKDQMQEGVVIAMSPNPLGRKGSYSFTLDSVKWEKLCNKTQNSFKILGILANKGNHRVEIEVSTNEGLMIGFFCPEPIELMDPFSIDTSHIYEKHFVNPEADEIAEIINHLKPHAKKLDLSTCFKIKLDTEYYTIKDLGNGNYLAVTKRGEVFELLHDPLQLKKIYNTLQEFTRNL